MQPGSQFPEQLVSRFAIVGVSYRHGTVEERALYATNEAQAAAILHTAREHGIRSLVILSTCNRTELYAYVADPAVLIDIFHKHTNGSYEVFDKTGYILSGREALTHLFKVAGGIDSQILGDREISGQFKKAIGFSRERDMVGPVMDKTLGFAIQAGKAIRTHTGLSAGTTSVSYAAIEWIRQHIPHANQSVLLYGTGKLGAGLAKNLCEYLDNPVTVVNRTDSRAASLAEALGISSAQHKDISTYFNESDIIILCAQSPEPVLKAAHFTTQKTRWVIDLSVPALVDPGIKNIPGCYVAGVDEISVMLNDGRSRREQELPAAWQIIENHLSEFFEWLRMQKHVPMIREMRDKLRALNAGQSLEEKFSDHHIHKTICALAENLRHRPDKGCSYIQSFHQYLSQYDKA